MNNRPPNGSRALEPFFSYYFQGAEVTDSDLKLIHMFEGWFRDMGRHLLSSVDDIGTIENITFGFKEFCKAVSGLVDGFAAVLCDRPTRVLAHIGLALILYRETILGPNPPRAHPIFVRFVGFDPTLSLAHLKSNLVGKFVSVYGYVVRVSSIQPLVTEAKFECPKCGALTHVFFEDGKYQLPQRCSNSQCRGKAFELRRETAVTVDFQTVKVDNKLSRKKKRSENFRSNTCLHRTARCPPSREYIPRTD
jgi:DNA replicative helicase MCM subunit Mcm2 (Cdc46/Mcm family)